MRHCLNLVLILLAFCSTASAQYQTLDFNVTKPDPALYTTDIPASAFTPEGLKLEMKKGVTYTLMSKDLYSSEYCFDLQFDVPQRGQSGRFYIDTVLENTQMKRKAVGSYASRGPQAQDGGVLRYYKDGKPQTLKWGDGLTDASQIHGVDGRRQHIEWIRMNKVGRRIFCLFKVKEDQYGWAGVSSYPRPTFFQEDCDAYQVGFTIRCDDDFAGTVLIRKLQLSGPAVKPRDKTNHTFLFDFGPINQELEDDFTPISELTMYDPQAGYGWVIPDPDKLWRSVDGEVPQATDKMIADNHLAPLPTDVEGWYISWLRQAYWCELNDRRLFSSASMGGDWIEFFKQWLDLKTPLERDYVGLSKPHQFSRDHMARRDIDERRASQYIDDDCDGEFRVDLPNGQYNLILGVGWSGDWMSSGEYAGFNVDINGRVRKKGLTGNWRRVTQQPIRNVEVNDGKMDIRFFADVRKTMNNYRTADTGVGWHINYIVILPAEERELMNEWEWKIIKKRGEKIRKVTFVEGEAPQLHNENGFISLNGKPFHFVKIMGNFHPGASDYYPYYQLGTLLQGDSAISGSQHFFKPDWEKLSYSDDYPWDLIDRLNVTYSWDLLSDLHGNSILSFVPHQVSGEGTPTMDSRGRINRYNVQPPLNSALGHEIQKEAFTMLANQIGVHPGWAGHFLYEELWHPDEAGYDDQSLLQYWGWLQRKYQTIEALNTDWGTKYAGFDEITPPPPGQKEFYEYTPQWVNFRTFRGWAQVQMIKTAMELVHKLEPQHISLGAKGDYGTQTWYPAEFLDMFGWYSPYLASSVSRFFGNTPVCGMYMFNCEHAYLDGRRQVDHKPGPRQYQGREERDMYNRMVSAAFKGAKGFWSEWYTNGMCHAFHRPGPIQRDASKYRIIHWTGQLAFYEPEAFTGPPVQLERAATQASAANQMFQRLAPLWLPAKPPQPKVLLAINETSNFLSFFGDRPYADLEDVSLRVLKSANLPVDVLHLPYVKDLSPYKLIVMAETTAAVSKAEVERLKQFVANGGKLIIINGGGFSDSDHPRRYTGNENKDEVFPLEAFADAGGYDLIAGNRWHMDMGKMDVRWLKTDVAPEFADNQPLGAWNTEHYLKARPGSTVFLKGTLEKGGKEVDIGILSKDRNIVAIRMPSKTASDDLIHPIARFFRKLTDSWNIDDRVVMDGVDDAWDSYAGYLQGDGYTLATVCNDNETNRLKTALKLRMLAPGQYTITDVTGLKPELSRKADGGLTIKPDPQASVMKVLATLSNEQLAKDGIACDVAPREARILLIRPANENTWVSVYKPTLTWLVHKPLTIAYGTSPADKNGAESLRVALEKVGVKVEVTPVTSVKVRHERREVRINPEYDDRKPNENTSKWYLLDTFENDLVDGDRNVIAVGSAQTNSLVDLWGKPGTFSYDKSAEKITAEYPGKGRGVIGIVEGINSAVYDPQSQCRDGLIVGGSDDAGTTAAVNKLVDLVAQYCKNPPPIAVPPPGPAERAKAEAAAAGAATAPAQ